MRNISRSDLCQIGADTRARCKPLVWRQDHPTGLRWARLTGRCTINLMDVGADNRLTKDTAITESSTRIIGACRRFMLPIARMLLTVGISYREFAEVTKASFVEAATSDYGLRGRPTNTSRVAVLTGLTRKEVKRLKQTLAKAEPEISKMGPASTLLHFWHKDADFLTDEGDPLDLIKDGPGPSFAELARRYGGDVPEGALLSELKRTGIVVEMPSGKLRAVSRYFVPKGAEHKFVDAVVFSLENICDTMASNVALPQDGKARFERYAWSDRLSETQRRQFEDFAVAKSRSLLEMLDDWLAANEVNAEGQPIRPTRQRVGLGIYYFDVGGDDSRSARSAGMEGENDSG